MLMLSPAGCRPMAIRAKSSTSTPRSAAHSRCRSFGGEYLELIPNELIRYTDVFDDPNLPGTIEVTVKLKAVSCGTEIDITQANVPSVIPAEMCYLGWQDSLQYLAMLVEAASAGE
jgi:uncharacterized protein YndB with AHSA1/START domain